MWHRDFPPAAREMWDIIAKAMMMRAGGTVNLSADECRRAAQTAAEIEMESDGSISFRVERS